MSNYNSEEEEIINIQTIKENKNKRKIKPLSEETKKIRAENIAKARETRSKNAQNNKTLKDVENNLKSLIISRKKEININDLIDDDNNNNNSDNSLLSEDKNIKKSKVIIA